MTTEPKDIQAVSPELVQSYMRTRASQFDAKKDLAEEHGRTKVAFQEETGGNKTAIAWVERLDRLSPEVRQDVRRTFDVLCDAMDSVWAQEETGDLFPDGGDTRDPAERLEQTRTAVTRGKPPVHWDGHPDDVGPPEDMLDGPKGSAAFEAAKAAIAKKNRDKRKPGAMNGGAETLVADRMAGADMAEVNREIAEQFAQIPDDEQGAVAG